MVLFFVFFCFYINKQQGRCYYNYDIYTGLGGGGENIFCLFLELFRQHTTGYNIEYCEH